MKRKTLILIIVSAIILTTSFGTAGIAFAQEIKDLLICDNFSNSEKELAISNLKEKFDGDELPDLLYVEELYDFNDSPLYGLYEFDNYFMIVIRETSSILERGEGNSVYYGLEGKKYYGGFEKSYIFTEHGYKELSTEKNTYATQKEIEQMIDYMANLRELDYQDYLEALNTPMLLGENNRHRINKLQNSLGKFDYFAKTLSVNYCKNHYYFASQYFDEILYTYSKFDPKPYGWIAMTDFRYGWDLFFPKNIYNDCALVAMIVVLQYYDRLSLNTELIPFDFGLNYTSYDDMLYLRDNPLLSRAEMLRALLHNYLGTLSSNGAATYVNIDAAFEKYFEAYNINCKATHFTSYTNIKKAVDDGNPAIMTVGAGKGWDINNNSEDINGHNLVVYGYTTNSIGVLDEFICHGCWMRAVELQSLSRDISTYNSEPSSNLTYTSQLFVNKFYAAGNVYINGI